MTALKEPANLADRITAFVRSFGREGEFNDLACDLFRYQFAHNAPYRRFCESRGVLPADVTSWDAIPAAPSEAFRNFDLTCSRSFPAVVFQTSGTTGGAIEGQAGGTTGGTTGGAMRGRRGRHLMDAAALDLYRVSLATGFHHLASRAAGLPIYALVAPFSKARDSSLSFMVSALAEEPSLAGRSHFFWQDGGPDIPAAAEALATANSPLLLFTTAFALVELLDFLESGIKLPGSSMVIETGGFKGRTREVSREELYGRSSQLLGVPLNHIGAEYGMCEMASQFYDRHLSAAGAEASTGALPEALKVGPPWVRTLATDPSTGAVSTQGVPGLLRHFDLCNLNSVAAIQTLDLGTIQGDGFVLHGRLPTAPPRGCSLTVEEWQEQRARGERIRELRTPGSDR